MRAALLAAVLLTWGGALLAGELDSIRQEPDLLRRFDRAIDHAHSQAHAARKLVHEEGPREELRKALGESVEAAGLALETLRETGRKPSRMTRQYKKGEMRTRDIEKLFGDLASALNYDARPLAEEAREAVSKIHDEFLQGVMGGK